jgi:hypothetical protein
MAFDLAAAMRAAGNTPDMYENQAQAMKDLQARAQSDPSFRQQMITQRARDWYQGYMGKPAPEMNRAPVINQAPAVNQGAMNPGDNIRNLLGQLRQAGVIA